MTFQVRRGRRWLIGAVAMTTGLGPMGVLAPAGAVASSGAGQDRPDVTSATEARRVDSVPTPKLAWEACEVGSRFQCTGVQLPLDYDLLTQAVPARGTKCVGDVQPFQDNPANPTVPPK